jgi:hypothetical protein
MQRMRPLTCGDADTPLPPVPEWPTPHAGTLSRTIPICDLRPARLHAVSRIISECDAHPHCIETASSIPQSVLAWTCKLAVIALGAYPSLGTLGLENIRGLKRHGFRVICHAEGMQSWPLGIRRQIFLAGASWLVDSAKPEFSQELRRLPAQVLQAED